MNYIYGKANFDGSTGFCCPEMDIWEANAMAGAYTPHPCKNDGNFAITTEDPKQECDSGGCDFNPYRMGTTDFYGPELTLDTSRPFTVVTQFLTEDETENTDIVSIKRLYVQDGNLYELPATNVEGQSKPHKDISDDMCMDMRKSFGDHNSFADMGGMK